MKARTARNTFAALSLLTLSLALTACGNKGPLILPPKDIPVDVPASSTPVQMGDAIDALNQVPKATEGKTDSDLDTDVDPPDTSDGDTPPVPEVKPVPPVPPSGGGSRG